MGTLTAYDKFMQQALKYGWSVFGLPKTGQTTSYRAGDDGDLEIGRPRKPPRFVDNDDGTITDNATGLMWVKQPENIGGIWVSGGQPTLRTWDQGIDDCLGLDYAGHNDWRLPNIIEYISIVNYGTSDPSTYPTFFPNTKPTFYWASTTYAPITTNALAPHFNYGTIAQGAKAASFYIRPVRLGRPAD